MSSQLKEAIAPGITALCKSVVNVPAIMSTAGVQLINSVKSIVENGTKQIYSDAKLAAITEVNNIKSSIMMGGSSRSYTRAKPCGCSCTRTIRYRRKKLSSTFKKKYTQ